MAKQSAFMAKIQKAQALKERQAQRVARTYQLDMVTLALGRMGWREKKFREFDEILTQVVDEYGRDIIADSKDDADIWYTKDTLDRELKQYVGGLFVPYDERYAWAVMN